MAQETIDAETKMVKSGMETLHYIDCDKGESSANLVHQSLEKAGRTTRLKWHASEFVQAHIGSGRKSSLGSITGMNWKLQYPHQAYGKKYN